MGRERERPGEELRREGGGEVVQMPAGGERD
jgi:hypothetical protein